MRGVMTGLFLIITVPVACAAEWVPVFSDEFLNEGRPDASKWRYERGFVRNSEPQWYSDALQNVAVRQGVLELIARKETLSQPNPDFVKAPPAVQASWPKQTTHIRFTSGSIDTKGKFAFRYGKMEVRARLPKGQGVWPAIWTLGVQRRHPDCGEIDVMEYVWSSQQTVWSTLHFVGSRDLPQRVRSGGFTGASVLDGAWHVYGMEWSAEKIIFTFDGMPYFTFPLDLANRPDGSNPFREPHYVKLNLALGAPGNWGGKLDETILPQTFAVDYIRIWQKQEATLGEKLTR
mgnify:FL=1